MSQMGQKVSHEGKDSISFNVEVNLKTLVYLCFIKVKKMIF